MYGSRLATTTTRMPASRSLRSETRRSRDHSAASKVCAFDGSHLSIVCLKVRASHAWAGTAWPKVQELVPRLFSPATANLDNGVHGFVHILDRHPFKPRVNVVLTGEQIWCRKAHERETRAVRAAANLMQSRRDARAFHPLSRVLDDFRVLFEHVLHVAILLLDDDLHRRSRIGATHLFRQ